MTCGARRLISPRVFKRPRSPMKSVFQMQLAKCLDQIFLATHSRKRNCVVQVVCECGGSRPDFPRNNADPGANASQLPREALPLAFIVHIANASNAVCGVYWATWDTGDISSFGFGAPNMY